MFLSRTFYYMAVSVQIYILYYLKDTMPPDIAAHAKSYTLGPKPQTPDPDPKSETQHANLKPEIQNPVHETRDRKRKRQTPGRI